MNPEAIEHLMKQGRDGYPARLAAGQARLKAGDYEQAAEHFRQALAFDDSQSLAWQGLGETCRALDDDEGARAAWQRGIEVAAKNGDKQAEKVMTVWLKRLARELK
ncbi:MAG: tetratricopeptide repeat protein [Wenzhouxiangellaceae bacterium]|nr:tetratricopeptide repeat protein [Wenzhouxiangellaceae bacterium]